MHKMIGRRPIVMGMLGAAAASGRVWAQAPVKWDLYAVTGVTHPITLRYKEFAEEVRKATNGKLEIVVRPAGELPFLVRNAQELDKVWPIIDKFTTPLFAKAGVKNLFYHTWPTQNVFGKGKPIRTIDDFKGRKIRSTDGKQAEMLKQLGASSVSLTTAEVPVAMERGVADGFITAGFNVVGAKWYEFVQWGWLGDIHIGGPDYTLVNIAAYDKLDADTRAKLDAVAKAYAPRFRAANLGDEAKDLDILKTQYKVDLFVPPKDQIDALMARMRPYWEQWSASQGANGTAMLKEIQAALGK